MKTKWKNDGWFSHPFEIHMVLTDLSSSSSSAAATGAFRLWNSKVSTHVLEIMKQNRLKTPTPTPELLQGFTVPAIHKLDVPLFISFTSRWEMWWFHYTVRVCIICVQEITTGSSWIRNTSACFFSENNCGLRRNNMFRKAKFRSHSSGAVRIMSGYITMVTIVIEVISQSIEVFAMLKKPRRERTYGAVLFPPSLCVHMWHMCTYVYKHIYIYMYSIHYNQLSVDSWL